MSRLVSNFLQAAALIVVGMPGILVGHAAFAEEVIDGEHLAATRCAACHTLEVPDEATQTLQEKRDRKGPPLHYAGQKYLRDWLARWLQAPVRITPSGGAFWSNAVVVTDEGDEVDESKLAAHIALDAGEAAAVADYLMTLKPYPQLAPEIAYTPGKVNTLLAKKDFRKFKGCAGCHRDTPDFGGVTGPELYTAMNRLQAAYIASYIADPRSWDSHTLMPVKDLNEKSIFKLMNYLNQIQEEP